MKSKEGIYNQIKLRNESIEGSKWIYESTISEEIGFCPRGVEGNGSYTTWFAVKLSSAFLCCVTVKSFKFFSNLSHFLEKWHYVPFKFQMCGWVKWQILKPLTRTNNQGTKIILTRNKGRLKKHYRLCPQSINPPFCKVKKHGSPKIPLFEI